MIDRMSIDPALYPTDLEALKSVFSQICEEGHVEPGSPAAEKLAADLVRLFQSGMSDESVLLIAARARFQAVKQAG
ncbi:MAG: hypothetical protein E5W81_02680 [Mesorhizobium sp.]|uniref:hypothetical protein n=1 Tax=Mesorhizobium sp. TaxID=1871066 RepID=UPI0012023CD1|nr:hypothetical protein [Mesorhizobium sp.]TIT24671.1 MAG: hypothetical protein E5W70_03030 [Mesorhizobium sp.]TKB98509.1 MAG: hypothetical protein E5W81_02680 [Mesorhizobium sp.]